MPLTDLPEELLEQIFSRLSLPNSANLGHLHPVLRRVYRRRIISALEDANSWEDFALVVDQVLDHHAGDLDRLSIRLRNFAADEYAVDTALFRWLNRAYHHRVSALELHGIRRLNITYTINYFHAFIWLTLRDLHLTRIHFPQFDPFSQFLIPNLQRLHLQDITMAPGNDLGWFLDTCPNLRVFVLHLCWGNGSLTLRFPLLEILNISLVLQWTVTIRHLPSLTDFHVHSQDLARFRLLQQPISMVPIPSLGREAGINVRSLFIVVENNLPVVISALQCFHYSLRHLDLFWYAHTNMDSQFEHRHELVALDTITIRGAPLYDEPLRIMVEYVLAHSHSLNRFTLVIPQHLHSRVLEDEYLFEIERVIRELPRSSEQVQFEFAWLETNDGQENT